MLFILNLSYWKYLKNGLIDPENVIGVVSDNAANIPLACKETFQKSSHIGCFAHSLNVVVTITIEQSELSENSQDIGNVQKN